MRWWLAEAGMCRGNARGSRRVIHLAGSDQGEEREISRGSINIMEICNSSGHFLFGDFRLRSMGAAGRKLFVACGKRKIRRREISSVSGLRKSQTGIEKR